MTQHGDLIRQIREERRINQRDLAKRVGHSQAYIVKIENGQQRGSYQALAKIAIALDIAPQKVLEKAGFLLYTKYASLDFILGQPEKDFAQLPPNLKSLVLELAPILYNYLKIANERGKANLPV